MSGTYLWIAGIEQSAQAAERFCCGARIQLTATSLDVICRVISAAIFGNETATDDLEPSHTRGIDVEAGPHRRIGAGLYRYNNG